ncbi:MAG: LPP20 family lipoprotein [Candidatus Marinimicrobia bacterium]|nr:LPP20 family lipoprotein [Candidatus Neomarinimicrobiota bacterium]
MRKIPAVLIFAFIILVSSSFSQWKVVDSSTNTKPSWVAETPTGKVFRYYSGMGSSNTSLQQAQENAVANILQQIVEEGTFNVSVESMTEISESIQTTAGGTNFEITDDFIREVVRTGTSKAIHGLHKEEEYWQSVNSSNGLEHQFWVLFKVPKPGMSSNTFANQGYGFDPVWRSIILPGWGQRYKGEKNKGSQYLTATATAGGATFLAFYMSDSYTRKAENERDLENRKFYNDWSGRSHTIGIISGLIAGGLYGYNIFDAMTAPGAKKYASVSPSNDHDLLALYDGCTTQVAIKLYF